jgi:hypothetical protein
MKPLGFIEYTGEMEMAIRRVVQPVSAHPYQPVRMELGSDGFFFRRTGNEWLLKSNLTHV